MNPYKKYRVLWKITHKGSPSIFWAEVSGVIKARTIAEVLKKEIKARSYSLPSYAQRDHLEISVCLIRELESRWAFVFVEGLWRKILLDTIAQ